MKRKEEEKIHELPRIKQVRAYVQDKKKSTSQGADCHDVDDKHWINGHPVPIANPMSKYPQYQHYRKSWGINALGSVIVEVEAENGVCGVGVSIGGVPACYLVEEHLSRFVEGQRPSAVELIWDQAWRGCMNYGRKGLALQALSALDIAVWDLLGKLRNAPVYELLGGPVREVLPVYCTTARPDVAQKFGFVGAKIPCPCGPADGDEGFRANVKFFREWREKLGPEYPLSLDCYMALSVPYTVKLAKALQPYNLKWIEEYLQPDDYAGYAEVKKQLGGICLLTTGEHEYTRYGFKQLLDMDCVDILQPDVTWLGGITEARRVVAMAQSHDKLVIPHGSSVYSYHLQFSFQNTPLAEFINLHPTGEDLVPYLGGLFTDEPVPHEGKIHLSQISKPGFGVTLNKAGLVRPYERPDSESERQFQLNVNLPPPKHVMPF